MAVLLYRFGSTRARLASGSLAPQGHSRILQALAYAQGPRFRDAHPSDPFAGSADVSLVLLSASPGTWLRVTHPGGPIVWIAEVSGPLRRFAATVATRALDQEHAVDRCPDPRSWDGVAAARAYAEGRMDLPTLRAAWDRACTAVDDRVRAALKPGLWDHGVHQAVNAAWSAAAATTADSCRAAFFATQDAGIYSPAVRAQTCHAPPTDPEGEALWQSARLVQCLVDTGMPTN